MKTVKKSKIDYLSQINNIKTKQRFPNLFSIMPNLTSQEMQFRWIPFSGP